MSNQLAWPATTSRGTILRSNTNDGMGLAICFDRCRDREAHALYGIAQGEDVLLLASEEGTADEAWPASPPLQHLTIECRDPHRNVALLIGMAGASHWSLSVDFDQARPRLVFEFACRCSSQPQRLGSTYRMPLAPTVVENRVTFGTSHNHRWTISPLERESCRTLLRIGPDVVRFEPRESDSWSLPRTISWGFEVTCEPLGTH